MLASIAAAQWVLAVLTVVFGPRLYSSARQSRLSTLTAATLAILCVVHVIVDTRYASHAATMSRRYAALPPELHYSPPPPIPSQEQARREVLTGERGGRETGRGCSARSAALASDAPA